jgi:hypothetical protein
MKKIAIIFLCFGLYGCGFKSDGLATLKDLCEKDAGVTIYKTVEVDGYYDTTGGFDLVVSPYKFYEFCDDSPSASKFNVIPDPGCYRVEKVKRKTGLCHQGYDDALVKLVVEPYPEFIKNNCIAVEKIGEPEARYSYHSDAKAWVDDNGVSEFRRSEIYIKDRVSSKVLSRYISYSYNKKPGHSSPKSCHVLNDKYPSYVTSKLIQSTINVLREN